MLRWNLAGLVLLVGAAVASADDTVRLGGPNVGADSIRLGGSFVADDDADTHLIHRGGYRGGYYGGRHYGSSFSFSFGRSHYGGYGGYRGGYWGGYGGYHRPYYSHHHYGHHRPYYSHYRPYYYSSFYHRPYYSSYRPYYYSYPTYYSSYPTYYSYPSYYLSAPAYSYYYVDPCAGQTLTMPEATTLGSSSYAAPSERAGPMMPPARESEGTFEYDGGPRQAVPMPDAAPAATPPRPALPRQFKLVSQPGAGTYSYAAYGEPPAAPTPAAASTRVVAATQSATPALPYAAYGARTK